MEEAERAFGLQILKKISTMKEVNDNGVSPMKNQFLFLKKGQNSATFRPCKGKYDSFFSVTPEK